MEQAYLADLLRRLVARMVRDLSERCLNCDRSSSKEGGAPRYCADRGACRLHGFLV